MAKVHLDYGHGGKDPGAVNNNLLEKDITLAIGTQVQNILKGDVAVSTSRTSDKFISLGDRTKIANAEKADIFVSIHINGHSNTAANGLETFSYPGSSVGAILSKDIHEAVWKTGLFKANRGLKTANFQVLRQTTMPAALIELGFISNKRDADMLRDKTNQLILAEALAKGILKHLGVTPKEEIKGTPILGESTTTVAQMKEWARIKKADSLFIDLADTFYKLAEAIGVNPAVVYTQSAKETGYMKFGGVLDASYHNPCGLKTTQGGGNNDPSAHKGFQNWAEGILAQLDHLSLYAGAVGYPKTSTPDPRHFPYLKGTAKTVEDLGGKWAPSSDYGKSIVRMMKELESIEVKEPELPEETKTIKAKEINIKLEDGTMIISYKEVK